MYDALAKGLTLSEGDVVSYMNAGDAYHPAAFGVVADILESRPDVHWLTGMNIACNPSLQVIGARLPYRFRRSHLRRGVYGGLVRSFVQQESTFWRPWLHTTLDLPRLTRLRLAGDFYLWKQFSTAAELHIVESYLGGFTHHPGQLSAGLSEYRRELRTLADPLSPLDIPLALFDRLISLSGSSRLKKLLNRRQILRFDLRTSIWR